MDNKGGNALIDTITQLYMKMNQKLRAYSWGGGKKPGGSGPCRPEPARGVQLVPVRPEGCSE